ncbi:MAG: response regulator [Oscillospiraceae bacterium]|nr:response regulator [Oscillospiraceae bacterium]
MYFNMEKLAKIPELSDLGFGFGVIDKLGESCDDFVTTFPEIEDKMQNAAASGDRQTLLSELNNLCEMLKKIGANGFALNRLEAFSQAFLADVACLSLDIQFTAYDLKNTIKSDKIMQQIMAGSSTVEVSSPVILSVDKSPVFSDRLKTALAGSRFKLICVTTGKDALNHINHNPPNLILVDSDLHDVDCFSLSAKIKEICSSHIVLLINAATKEIVDKAIRAGLSDIMIKSIHGEQILKRINKHFIKSRAVI